MSESRRGSADGSGPVWVAAAALVRDGRILLAHRSASRTWYPDCWDLIGGHVEVGENAEEAVVRECREELGVWIRDPEPLPLVVADPDVRLSAFVVHRWDGQIANLAPDEHDRLGWFDCTELTKVTLADRSCVEYLKALIRHGAEGIDNWHAREFM